MTVRQDEGGVQTGSLPIDYYGDLRESYERWNADYVAEVRT